MSLRVIISTNLFLFLDASATLLHLFGKGMKMSGITTSEIDTADTADSLVASSREVNAIFSKLNEEELLALVETALDKLGTYKLTLVIETAQGKRRKKQDEARETLLKELREKAAGM